MMYFKKALQSFAKKRILIIGDFIVDMYHEGKTLGTSSETPTIVVQDESLRISHGGAALLTRNILALGGSVIFVSVVGNDEYASYADDFIHKDLKKFFVSEKDRKTTVKERFFSNGYKLLQWDRLNNSPISQRTEERVLSLVKRNLNFCDVLAVSDFRHGVMTEHLASELVCEAHRSKKPIYIDSQVSQQRGNHIWYRGASSVCVNKKEASSIDPEFQDTVSKVSLERLSSILDIPDVVVKLGERGSASLLNGNFFATDPYPVNSFDTVGAGDAFFSILILSSGSLSAKDFELANIWAALSTTIAGPNPPTLQMLEKALKR